MKAETNNLNIHLWRDASGASLIEFLLFFPLFLAGLFIFIWLGVAINARGALSAAVDNGVRLAATRGKGVLYGKVDSNYLPVGAIPQIDNWVDSAGASSLGRAGLIIGNGGQMSNYDKNVKDVFDPVSVDKLISLPPEFSYGMAYIVQAMRMSVGESLRYPCDPRDTDHTDSMHGDNCLQCRPVNPISFNDKEPLKPADLAVMQRRMAIRCDFKPAPYLLRPILRLLSIMTGQVGGTSNDVGVISHYSYFDRNSNCYFVDGTPNSSMPPKYCCADPDRTTRCH